MPVAHSEHVPGGVATHYQPLVAVVAAFAGGIVFDRYVGLSPRFAWGAALALLVEWALFLRAGRDRSAAAALLSAVALAGGAWHHARWHYYSEDEIGRFARLEPRPVCIEIVARASARAVSAPPPNPLRLAPTTERTRLVADAVAIRDETTWRACSGRVMVIVDGRLRSIRAGERLRVFGRLSAPRPRQNPGEIDFAAYARGDRVLARLSVERPEAVATVDSSDFGNPLVRVLDAIRVWGDGVLWRHLEPSQAALAEAVLLGAREHLDDSRLDAYVETGTVHILSVSGLHVGILAGFLFLFLRLGLLPRRMALVLVAATIVAYALVTYAEPPIVRAAILVVLICLGRLAGRDVLSFNSLAAAAIVVLAMNPADLFRTGAQLSFLAIATFGAFGLQSIFSSPEDPLDRLIAQSRPWAIRTLFGTQRWVVDLIITSAMVWLVSLPLVMSRFNLFNPVAIGLNVVMWVPTVLAMWFGFLLLVTGWFPPLASVFAAICNGSLAALDGVVHFARDLGYGMWWVAGPDNWWLVGLYALLIGFVVLRPWPTLRWKMAVLMAWIAVAFGVAGYRALPRETLTCTFLSVGHGCAVVVELPDGRTLLYDAGHFGSPENGAETIARFLWSRGINRLDAVVISHNDADHFNAAPALLARIPARVVYVSPTMYRRPSRATEALRAFFAQNRIVVREVSSDQRFAAGGGDRGFTIDVLHPPPEGVRGTDNANSIVLELTYRGWRILLTGDLEGDGLARVVQMPPCDCDVLLAPHHGSPRSSPEGTVPPDSHKLKWPSLPTIRAYDGRVNEFNQLRLRAREKRDKALAHIRAEYEANLVQIAALEQDLLGKVSRRYKRISAAIESVIPSDVTFTTADIMTGLEALDPGRAWRKRSIDNHLSRLRERGIVKRLRRATIREPAIYARSDLGGDAADNRTLAEAIRAVLTRPMQVTEIAVAVKEAGYQSSMGKRDFRSEIARVLREGGFQRDGDRWKAPQ